jgi:ABC-type uncharacterized transport system permease subunit
MKVGEEVKDGKVNMNLLKTVCKNCFQEIVDNLWRNSIIFFEDFNTSLLIFTG